MSNRSFPQLLRIARRANLHSTGRVKTSQIAPESTDATKAISEKISSDIRQQVAKLEFPTVITRSEHIQRLSKYYSPKMLKSVIAAEQTVTPDLWNKRKKAKPVFPLSYVDDLGKHDPFYDLPKMPWTDFSEPHQPVPPPSDLPPTVPPDLMNTDVVEAELTNNRGISSDYLRRLIVRPLVRKLVSNVTRLGKIRSFYSLVIVGDQNGMIGIGEAKDRNEASRAVMKAKSKALRNMFYIPRLDNRTIFCSLENNYHGVDVVLWPRPPGFGLRVNHLIHEVAVCAGLKDLSGKVRGSRNKMNTIKATIEMLRNQVLPEEIAQARGKKAVDIKKTYFSARN
ncbi:hypothetical protein V1525DRAFT_402434 [Lipomyces kononenkoae]|uniref:Uncharacterized protein n=1 Tax=Lipomyces kononenkoae TaxID=34357 RepID=A0ACC3T2I1_LIPKO